MHCRTLATSSPGTPRSTQLSTVCWAALKPCARRTCSSCCWQSPKNRNELSLPKNSTLTSHWRTLAPYRNCVLDKFSSKSLSVRRYNSLIKSAHYANPVLTCSSQRCVTALSLFEELSPFPFICQALAGILLAEGLLEFIRSFARSHNLLVLEPARRTRSPTTMPLRLQRSLVVFKGKQDNDSEGGTRSSLLN